MLFLGEIALFSFFVVVSFYFPGTFILNLLKINFSKIDNLAPSLILGILFYSLTALLFIKVGFSYQAIFLILLIFNFTYFYGLNILLTMFTPAGKFLRFAVLKLIFPKNGRL